MGTVVFTANPNQPGTTRLIVTGELDLAVRDDLSDAITRALAHPGVRELCVDFDATTFIDSSTVGALVVGYHAARRAGCAMRVENAHGGVLRVLTITGVADLLISG